MRCSFSGSLSPLARPSENSVSACSGWRRVVAGGGQQARLGLARHFELLVLAGQLRRGLCDAALQQPLAFSEGARGLVEAVLQAPHLGRAGDLDAGFLAGTQPVHRVAQFADGRADAPRGPPVPAADADQARGQHDEHVEPDAVPGLLHRVEADLDHDLAGGGAVVAHHLRDHLEAFGLRGIGAGGIGHDFAIVGPDLHPRFAAARCRIVRCAQQGAPVHAHQRHLRHGRHLQRHRLAVGPHEVGHAAQVLPREHGDGAQRGHDSWQQREQHQLAAPAKDGSAGSARARGGPGRWGSQPLQMSSCSYKRHELQSGWYLIVFLRTAL